MKSVLCELSKFRGEPVGSASITPISDIDSTAANSSHFVAKVGRKQYGFKQFERGWTKYSAADAEELAFDISELLGWEIVSRCTRIPSPMLSAVHGDSMLIEWKRGQVLEDYCEELSPDHLFSLGMLIAFWWLTEMSDRHTGNILIGRNKCFSIDNEDAFSFQCNDQPNGFGLEHFNEYTYLFEKVECFEYIMAGLNLGLFEIFKHKTEIIHLIEGTFPFVNVNLFKHKNWRAAAEHFYRDMNRCIVNSEKDIW